MSNQSSQPTLSVYVDAQHLYHAARSAGDKLGMHLARPDYDAVLSEAVQHAGRMLGVDWRDVSVTHQRIYSASKNRTTAFDNALDRLGYTVKSYILRSETDNFDWDVQIMADLINDLYELIAKGDCAPDNIHAVVIVSGDGDFAGPLNDLEERHPVRVMALGYEGTMSSRFHHAETLTRRTLYVNS